MQSSTTTLFVLPLALLLVGLLAGVAVGWVLGNRKATTLERDRAAAVEAARIQAERIQEYQERSDQDIDVLQALAPLTERMRQMHDNVNRLERDRAQQFGDVSRALHTAQETDRDLQRITVALEGALRSNSARGTWGEIQLRRVVEAAGMVAHVDFAEQVQVQGKEATLRPDMVVHLPGERTIVLDAKAPLSAYLQAQQGGSSAHANAESTPSAAARDQSAHLAAHAKAVRAHVDDLGKKKYWEALGHSPDLVLCFIPLESALAAALEADPTLLDYAAARNVALVSPVSLLASLKAVAFSWRQESLRHDATQLLQLSRELYDRLGSVGSHLSKMGGSLRRSVDQYNELVGSLERRVLPTARKLNTWDLTATEDPRLHVAAVDAQPKVITAPELLDAPHHAQP